jgi:hypothetical protein
VITDGTDWYYRIKGAIRVGTAIEIPPDMLAAANDPYYTDHPNPTHHGVVFLQVYTLGSRLVSSDGGPPEGRFAISSQARREAEPAVCCVQKAL